MTLSDIAFNLPFIIKLLFLGVIGLYIVFVVIVFINIRSLGKLIIVQRTMGSPLINTVTFIYLLLTISLFIMALVIL